MYQYLLYKLLTFLSPNFYKEISNYLINANRVNIIDVGFFRGSFTKGLLLELFANNENLTSSIYSFDPNKSINISEFDKFAKKNSIDWKHSYLALGNKKSVESFYILKKFPSSGSSINNILIDSLWFKTRKYILSPFTKSEDSFIKIEVDVEMVDNLFRDRHDIDLLKIDVEGYTYEVLEGAKSLIQKNNPIIQLEILSRKKDFEKREEQIVKYLENLGYKSFLKKKHYTTHLFSDVICSDYLFVNSNHDIN